MDNTYYLFVLGHKNRKNIDENKNKRLKLASYFALAKINTVLKINTAPISSIEEKVTFKKIKERIIEQSGSPTVKILASVGLK